MVIAKFFTVFDGLPKDVKYNCRLELDVSASSCLNCAEYVAKFVRHLRAAGCRVTATAHFGRAYQGGQKEKPTVVPDAATQQQAYDNLKQNGLLSASPAQARMWGREADRPATPTTGSQQLDRGKEQAKAALAVLRNAQVGVEVLTLARMDPATTGNLSAEQKRMMERRAAQLEKWLAEAEKELVGP
ncbi:hypothetical protein [Lentzea atacamensis]|uniref:hypothetical protein n=1 Tax=Lentzea atacamensis TaxID=531938 RepID=UPI000D6BFBD6|nr:hypothetical protein [Lentzea atacamensis]